MRKFAFVLSGFAALAITLFVSSTSAIEPTYSLITAWDDHDIEIRDYDALFGDDATERGTELGISVLAGYIFGGNEEQELR